MRRAVGVVLLGIGAFFIVLAPLLRYPVAGKLVHAQSNVYSVGRLTAQNASYFSVPDRKVLTGTLEATVTTRGDVADAKDGRVVWDQFTAVNDVTNNNRGISLTQFRSAFNQFDGTGVTCCGASVNKRPVQLEGQIFMFPYGVEKKTYKVFNVETQKAFDANFVGEDTINGLTVYKFEQKIPPTVTQTLSAPAAMLGMTDPGDVQISRVYDAVNTFWVEPTTGAQVQQEQQRHEVLKTADGVDRMPALVATFSFTPETVSDLVGRVREGMDQIRLIETTAPLVSLILGAVFLVAGFLLRRGSPTEG